MMYSAVTSIHHRLLHLFTRLNYNEPDFLPIQGKAIGLLKVEFQLWYHFKSFVWVKLDQNIFHYILIERSIFCLLQILKKSQAACFPDPQKKSCISINEYKVSFDWLR